jgi:hypothetical protein
MFRHPSEHWAGSTGKYLVGKSSLHNIKRTNRGKIDEIAWLTVDATALAILKRQGCRGITVVSGQKKFLFEIHVNQYELK